MTALLLTGDCIAMMNALPEQSVQTCITSPPYFGLRDYGCDGQVGLESTPDEYVEKMVDVFRAVRRVLRDDGTVWLNLGDSYKSKQLLGIPWRVAFALQADGWYLRQDIIWYKANCVPESMRDRCTKSHEYVFLLSKRPKYYYGYEDAKEPAIWDLDGTGTIKRKARQKDGLKSNPSSSNAGIRKTYPDGKHGKAGLPPVKTVTGMRNRRSVWKVAPAQYRAAHFATFPPLLIEPCVLAGCPVDGTVLDPFSGSGTTGQVALQHGRKYIGIELNPEYQQLARERLSL